MGANSTHEAARHDATLRSLLEPGCEALTRYEQTALRAVLARSAELVAENAQMRKTAANLERRLRHAYRTEFIDRYRPIAATNGLADSEIESLAEQHAARLIAEQAEADAWVPPQFALDPARYFANGRCRICGAQAGRNHMFMCENGTWDREQQSAPSEPGCVPAEQGGNGV